MASRVFRSSLFLGAAGAALGIASLPAHAQAPAQAQPAPMVVETSQDDQAAPVEASRVVVIGEIVYRNRSEETAPVLEYGLDYFQRFEPLTVGDALKRVPSVSFLSDVLESDGVRLRGLDPAYTQILINGEKVPGAGSDSGAFGNGADGAFFVDRIPAELIERVEIVRSASANRSGDAMAGALNIVLRDGYSLEGGYVRLGALGFDDGRIRETYGAVWGGEVGGGRLLLGANVQGRRNPKEKLSLRYGSPSDTSLDNYEIQTDKRNGTDYSANFAYERELGDGKFGIDGFFVKTDRTQDEDSIEYNGPAQNEAPNTLSTMNDNDVAIDQESWSFNGRYSFMLLGGETRVKLGAANFKDSEYEFEDETEYLRDANIFPEADRYTGELSTAEVEDKEYKAKLEHSRDLGGMKLEAGLHFETKERDNNLRATTDATRVRVNLPAGTISGARPSTVTPPGLANLAPESVNTMERTQIAPYAMLNGKMDAISWEAGLRFEATSLDVDDQVAAASTSDDYNVFLPSAHVRWDLTADDRVTGSLARTIRNPSFNFLSPAHLDEELADNDFQGDPTLQPETAWGVDAGYERRLGRSGVAGINFFFRDVTDRIELGTLKQADGVTVVEGSAGPGTVVYTPTNISDGQVWGVEIDYSAPLDFAGLPDTGVFFNYSWLDSDTTDQFGSRRFNSQSDYIMNVGFIHDLPAWGAAFGVTWRKQGDAESRVVGEEVVTSYDGVLEAFVEKSFGDRFTIRLTGGNLTDGRKDEAFNKFASFGDQVSRTFDEYELETENAGPTWQLVGRMSF